jgi:casein kinase II subunit beta
MLYGLIHARWILQPRGLALMKDKFQTGAFGECPRFQCHEQWVIPIGESQQPRKHSAKVYCPKCGDIYRPEGVTVDGAHFGSAFPHVFLIEYPQFNSRDQFEQFVPEIFGFTKFERPDKFIAHAIALASGGDDDTPPD